MRSLWSNEAEEKKEKEEMTFGGRYNYSNCICPFFFRRVIIMKARVEPDICIGCELCVQTCPEVFRMEADKAVAFVSIVPGDIEDTCKQAADECPVTAIIIE